MKFPLTGLMSSQGNAEEEESGRSVFSLSLLLYFSVISVSVPFYVSLSHSVYLSVFCLSAM